MISTGYIPLLYTNTLLLLPCHTQVLFAKRHFSKPATLFYSIYWSLLNPSADFKESAASIIICLYNSNILFIIYSGGAPPEAELFAEQQCGYWQYSGAVLLNF